MDDRRLTPEKAHQPRGNVALASMLPWGLFIAALALAVWALIPGAKPEPPDPLAVSLAAFEKQPRLTVFSAQVSPVVAGEESGFLGLTKSRQIAVIPARVDYALDLSAMDRKRLSWDGKAQRLDVRLPPLQVTRPNLDEGRAQYLREGVWFARRTDDKLTGDTIRLAEQQASQQATNPALLDLARAAAREAIRQNLAIPLEVAGFGKVSVTVRFDGEAYQPQAR
jgi:hypothetical protein